MQQRIHDLTGYTIRATDGEVGKVDEFYFDDATWTIRYMVVKTGNWLSGRVVLISCAALGKPEWESRIFPVNLTCEQVRNSPDIDTERSVNRQHEAQLHEYYQWPQYWEGGYGGVFGITPYPVFENSMLKEPSESEHHDDPHLRSTKHVTGYHVHAIDGEIGHIADFIINEENWTIGNLVVDTGNWLPGRKVLIPPAWIKSINWDETSVYTDRPRESVKNSPELEASKT
jgi:uncharacterized protein YrrD